MDLKQNTLQSIISCTDLVSPEGYSLRLNAFRVWQEKRGHSIQYIAKRAKLSQEEIERKLEQREIFDKETLTRLVYLMGAKDAFFVIYFPSFKFRRAVYFQVFGKQMKYEKRRLKK